MFHKFLVAYDGSSGSRKALATAITMAKEANGEICALSVEEHLPHYAATVGEMDEERETADAHFATLQAEARAFAAEQGVELQTKLVAGHAAQEIVRVACAGGYDLLVIGHSGHSNVWGRFMGTTADKVSRHAPCSVLIVR